MVRKVQRTGYGAIRVGRPSLQEEPGSVEISDTEDDETPSEVQAALEALSGSGEYTISISRYNEEKALWEIVKKMPLDQFNEEQIATKYGGGQYKFIVRTPEGTFKQQIRANYATPMDERGNAAAGVDSSQKELVTMLQKELEQSRAKEANLYSGMFGMMTELIKSNNAPRPDSDNGSFIDTYVKLRALDGKNPAAEVTSVIDLIKTGMSMGKDLGMAAADTSPEDMIVKKLIDVAGTSLPGIIAALSKLPQQGAPRQQAAPVEQPAGIVPFVPNISIPQPAAPAQREVPMNEYKSELEKNVIEVLIASKKDLLFAAAASIDTDFVVNSILTKLTPEAADNLFDYYSGDGSIERTIQLIPEFQPYMDWLKRVLVSVMAELEKEQAPAETLSAKESENV